MFRGRSGHERAIRGCVSPGPRVSPGHEGSAKTTWAQSQTTGFKERSTTSNTTCGLRLHFGHLCGVFVQILKISFYFSFGHGYGRV